MKSALISLKIRDTIYSMGDTVWLSTMQHPVATGNVKYELNTIYLVEPYYENSTPYYELVLRRPHTGGDSAYSWEYFSAGYYYTGLSDIEHDQTSEYYKARIHYYAPLEALHKDLSQPALRMLRTTPSSEPDTLADTTDISA